MTTSPRTDVIRMALAQLNPTVGDIEGNKTRIAEAHRDAAEAGAHLLICPELIVSGYPPEDLILRPAYAAACRAAVEALAPLTKDGPALVLNSPWPVSE